MNLVGARLGGVRSGGWEGWGMGGVRSGRRGGVGE